MFVFNSLFAVFNFIHFFQTIKMPSKQYINEQIVNKTVGPFEFKKLIETWNYTVIDIRTKDELRFFGFIPGMDYNLDFYNQSDMKELFSMDKNKKYLIYCYHGNRSWYLKQEMVNKAWFKYVIDLSWGTENRLKQGFKLIKK